MNMKVKIAIAAVIVVALIGLIVVDQVSSKKKPKAEPPPTANAPLFKNNVKPKIEASEENELTLSDFKKTTPQPDGKPIKGEEPVKKNETIKPTDEADTGSEEYVIKTGDTLASISGRRYGDENLWKVILDANPGLRPSALKVGQKIQLPIKPVVKNTGDTAQVETTGNGRVYTVQAGDDLGKISKKFYNSTRYWEKIFEANRDKLASPDEIHAGMKIVLPEITPVAPRKETTDPTMVPPSDDSTLAGKKTHKVQANDSLWKIAEKYRGDRGVLEMIDLMVKANHDKIRDTNATLHVGWTLVIP